VSQEKVDERVTPYLEAASRRDVAAMLQWWRNAFNRRDLDAVLAVTPPEYEMHWRPEVPDFGGAVFRGPDGVRQVWRRLNADWDDFRLESFELIAEGDLAVAGYRQSARIPESDLRVEAQHFAVIKLRADGRIVEVHIHADRREALEAAGLRE